MGTTKDEKLPPIFILKEGTDQGQEAIQDFFLAWTIRCSAEKYKSSNPTLQEYARRIVYALIHGFHDDNDCYLLPKGVNIGEIPADFKITSAKVFRQVSNIDIVAEIQVENDGLYILNIEDKFYSNISDGQLASAKKILVGKYKHIQPKVKMVHLVTYADSNVTEKNKNQCKTNGYKFPDLDTVSGWAGIDKEKCQLTGNDLFDEYWIHGFRELDD